MGKGGFRDFESLRAVKVAKLLEKVGRIELLEWPTRKGTRPPLQVVRRRDLPLEQCDSERNRFNQVAFFIVNACDRSFDES